MNRLRAFWRERQRRPLPLGVPSTSSRLLELEDPHSELSRNWDEEHNRHVMEYLLRRVEPEFSAAVWQAFHRVAVEGQDAGRAAADLGMTVASVYTAKHRVLKRLRQEGCELLD